MSEAFVSTLQPRGQARGVTGPCSTQSGSDGGGVAPSWGRVRFQDATLHLTEVTQKGHGQHSPHTGGSPLPLKYFRHTRLPMVGTATEE